MTTTLSHPPVEPRPLEAHVSAFEAFEKATADHSPPWLRALRTSGISYFAELGFPTTDHEEWRFINVAPVAAFPFKPVPRHLLNSVASEDLARYTFGGMDACRLVFVDGHFAEELSTPTVLSSGVLVGSLAVAIERQGVLVEPRLGRSAHHESSAFTALNTAFIQDGAFIYIPTGVNLEIPVHLLFVSSQPGTVNQPRNLVIAEAGSRLRVIEDYVTLAGAACVTNAVTEMFTGEGAALEHLKLQREGAAAFHVATIEAHHQRESRVLSHSISLGARLARNDINLRFDGEGCESILNGLFLATGEQSVDHHTVADHLKPHCASHEFYHGILADKAKGVFNGKIFVRKDAQHTNAKQTNKNLLLGDEASINTKPQLEILADDVKCTHGATVGQLDDEAIFYLRSRGIGEDRARQMLIRAFASAVLNRITIEPVREELERALEERLRSQQESHV